MSQKEELKGTDYPKYLLGDDLVECSKIYGDKFEDLWNSLTPQMKDVKWGKILVFGTINKIEQDEPERRV